MFFMSLIFVALISGSQSNFRGAYLPPPTVQECVDSVLVEATKAVVFHITRSAFSAIGHVVGGTDSVFIVR